MHRQWNQIEMEWGGDRNFSPQDLGERWVVKWVGQKQLAANNGTSAFIYCLCDLRNRMKSQGIGFTFSCHMSSSSLASLFFFNPHLLNHMLEIIHIFSQSFPRHQVCTCYHIYFLIFCGFSHQNINFRGQKLLSISYRQLLLD